MRYAPALFGIPLVAVWEESPEDYRGIAAVHFGRPRLDAAHHFAGSAVHHLRHRPSQEIVAAAEMPSDSCGC